MSSRKAEARSRAERKFFCSDSPHAKTTFRVDARFGESIVLRRKEKVCTEIEETKRGGKIVGFSGCAVGSLNLTTGETAWLA